MGPSLHLWHLFHLYNDPKDGRVASFPKGATSDALEDGSCEHAHKAISRLSTSNPRMEYAGHVAVHQEVLLL